MGRRDWLFLLAGWFLASMALIGIGQTRLLISKDRVLRYQEGDLIEDDYVVITDFTFVDEDATAKLVSLNRSLANPVYVVSSEITSSVLQRYDRFASYFISALSDSKVAERLRIEFPGTAGLIGRETPRGEQELDQLLNITRDVLMDVQYDGIFRFDPEDGVAASGIIEVVHTEEASGRRVTLVRDSVIRPETLGNRIGSLASLKDLPPQDREFVVALAVFFSEPNGYLNKSLTEENMNQAESATVPMTISVSAGTRLLTIGGIVTARQARTLEALRNQRNLGLHGVLDPLLFVAIIFAVGFVATGTFGITLANPKTMWLYITLAGAYILLAGVLDAFVHFPDSLSLSVILPTALFTLLLAQLLQDRRMAVLSSVLMAFLVYFLRSESGPDLIITLAAGVGGAVVVKRRETRMGLLHAGPRLAGILLLVTFLSSLLVGRSPRDAMVMSLVGAANGIITGILSLAFLPLLEHLLNTATTFRLIELSDHNVPILKRMRLQAPGTYIHSQNVAHLAEAACDAIGADGLLARVGAYYHDIGKVDQAHFFVENQSGENKHDDMKATLSVAVIKSHVKIGIEKGRELRLPDEVLAVIEQHHGTSVIRYFYDRALKEKGGNSASPGDFSYGGPKPRSREAAVVMLADLAEAATRTLERPSSARLEKYVWDLIMDRFKAGELNESYLTLRDLETVKGTFVHVLTGHFHARIEYPKGSEND